MSVITISRQFGSGGDAIADQLCRILNYRQFDKRLISEAAIDAAVSEQEIVDFSEDNYRVNKFFDRLFKRSRIVATTHIWKEDTSGVREIEEMNLGEEHALFLVQKAIELAYRTGDTGIVGRGGQGLLKDRPDVLDFRIEAPMEDRIQRLKAQLKEEQHMPLDTIDTRRAAQDLIEAKDAASADYLKHFYGKDWSDPMLYHAVLNTGMLGIDQATQLIIEMVHCLEVVRPTG